MVASGVIRDDVLELAVNICNSTRTVGSGDSYVLMACIAAGRKDLVKPLIDNLPPESRDSIVSSAREELSRSGYSSAAMGLATQGTGFKSLAAEIGFGFLGLFLGRKSPTNLIPVSYMHRLDANLEGLVY